MARHINTTKANIIFLYLFLTPSKRHRLRLPATYQSIDCSVNKFFRVKANALSRRRWGREWILLTIVRADNSVARVIWIFDVRIKSRRLVTTGFLFHRRVRNSPYGSQYGGPSVGRCSNERANSDLRLRDGYGFPVSFHASICDREIPVLEKYEITEWDIPHVEWDRPYKILEITASEWGCSRSHVLLLWPPQPFCYRGNLA